MEALNPTQKLEVAEFLLSHSQVLVNLFSEEAAIQSPPVDQDVLADDANFEQSLAMLNQVLNEALAEVARVLAVPEIAANLRALIGEAAFTIISTSLTAVLEILALASLVVEFEQKEATNAEHLGDGVTVFRLQDDELRPDLFS